MKNTQNTTIQPISTSQNSPGGLMGALTPIVLMVLVFYFLIIRPQQKREAKNKELLNSIKKGDKVVTAAGIIGVVHKIISDKELSLEIAESIRIRIVKSSVTQILEKSSELGREEIEKENVPKSNVSKSTAKDKEGSSRAKK
jgi:preprotein translocase subunit YajC